MQGCFFCVVPMVLSWCWSAIMGWSCDGHVMVMLSQLSFYTMYWTLNKIGEK